MLFVFFRYESRGIGCYMFKIDDDTVIGYMNLIAFFDFHQIWILTRLTDRF